MAKRLVLAVGLAMIWANAGGIAGRVPSWLALRVAYGASGTPKGVCIKWSNKWNAYALAHGSTLQIVGQQAKADGEALVWCALLVQDIKSGQTACYRLHTDTSLRVWNATGQALPRVDCAHPWAKTPLKGPVA